ncbi:unnamed protein product [Rotaria sp. Silwood2]|nr:unnamed protein product [Rotaria sp. Silwood2]CAF3121877.1 unnamed protein product [Rotaria sp. Silwood2]CAF3283834.1 unnamed protein product [Rotaria sp. Silwood2]CAF3411767.1 unnamed protein product [Rotaria sp. Silwood2]CAF4181441.1 unnamed protein product [Rotaria sp. Silwood2]
MKVIALISGGKDGTFNMMECVKNDHEIVALLCLKPKQLESVTIQMKNEEIPELESYMYQSIGNRMLDLYAEAMELPLYIRSITIKPINMSSAAEPHAEINQIDDLYEILKDIKQDLEKKNGYVIDGLSCGVIERFDMYHKNHVDSICERLNIKPLVYLWQRNQSEILNDMVSSHLEAILIKVACRGLNPEEHLGKTLAEVRPSLIELEKYGASVCGEDGEYESLTLDCPLFKRKRIIIDEFEIKTFSNDTVDKIGYFLFKKFHLQDK